MKIGDEKFPDIAGFAEIENRTVLEDLLKEKKLTNYGIIHEESPDERGIDVGLIYNKNTVKNTAYTSIPVNTIGYKVRDILYCKMLLQNSDTIHVFVNHWKSRSGGQQETEPQRIICAQTLKNELDSIRLTNISAKIIIVGDLNDTPLDKSVKETLKADNTDSQGSLFNLMMAFAQQGIGTHSYRGNWDVLDHIIVSNSLLYNSKGYSVDNSEAHIYSADWITFTSKNGSKSPNRTYGGNNYYGGFSDHYPVFVRLIKY